MGLNARIVDLPNKLYASSLSHQIGSRMTTRPGGEDSLRSSLLRSRIAKLPHLPAIAPSSHPYNHQTSGDGEEEENDELGSLSMAAPPPRSASQRQAKTSNLTPLYSPLSANDCFDSALEVDVGDEEGEGSVMKAEQNDSHLASSSDSSGRTKKATFRVYYTPAKPQAASKIDTMSHLNAVDQVKPPSLHSWRPDQDNDGSADELDADTEGHQSDTFFFFHHGAGYSALSYALVAKHITESSNRRAGIIAFDCRGHGKTTHSTKAESEELSLDNLTNDCMQLLEKLFPKEMHQPTLILVGHSMGGSVVVSLCHALSLAAKTKAVPRVAGVVVLDVVEGTAMSALPVMKTIVSALPKGFGSVEEAIQWHLDSGTIVNAQSARRSVPSLLERNENEAGGASETKTREVVVEEPMEELLSTSPSSSSSQVDPVERHFAYRWRANLLATEPYWSGWFQGLSQSFLSVKCARLLVLAGTDRLDKDLMIGQMQGKYQLIVFSDVGHSLQEDAPQRTAETLIDFWKRNESLNITRIPGGLRRVGQP